MKSEKRVKLGKRKALIFVVLLAIVVSLSIGTASVATHSSGKPMQDADVSTCPTISSHAEYAVFCAYNKAKVSSNNDTITSGLHLVQYHYGLSVNNIDDASDTVLGNLVYTLHADNISDVQYEEHADWNNSYVKWFFPSDFVLAEGDVLHVDAKTSSFETQYVPMSISRNVNKSIFDADGYQLAEFNVTFEDINYDYYGGYFQTKESSLVNTSFLPDTFITDAPLFAYKTEHEIEFYLNKSQLQANETYNFSVVVRVDLKGDNPSPILYKPYYSIYLGFNGSSATGPTGMNVTMPSEMLPEHIHYASASTNVSNKWELLRGNQLSVKLEKVSEPLGPTISIYTDKTSYTIGDTMRLGLDVANSGDALPVRFAVWLEMPDGGIVPVQYTSTPVTLPVGLNYCNPNFMMFPSLPSLPAGTYTWHAALIEPSGPIEFISHDIVEWEFIGRGVPIEIEDITEMLEQTAVVIDFGEWVEV